jgi:hypothetical protein
MPNFSRKHYEMIARIIGHSNIPDEEILLLSTYFKKDNNRFDCKRFEHAIANHRDNNR